MNPKAKLNYWRKTIAELEKFIIFHEKVARTGCSNNLSEKIAYIVNTYERATNDTVNRLKSQQADIQVFLRALALLIDTTMSSDTHREKNARLRAISEMLEKAIQRCRSEQDIELSHIGSRGFIDLFCNDWPMRSYIQRIHNLKAENKKLQEALAKAGEPIKSIADLYTAVEPDNQPEF